MLEETNAAATWIGSLLDSAKVPAYQRNAFIQALSTELTQVYRGHWYEDTPVRGQAYRSIRVDLKYGHLDAPVRNAAIAVGLGNTTGVFKLEGDTMTVFVDPFEVEAELRFGREQIYRRERPAFGSPTTSRNQLSARDPLVESPPDSPRKISPIGSPPKSVFRPSSGPPPGLTYRQPPKASPPRMSSPPFTPSSPPPSVRTSPRGQSNNFGYYGPPQYEKQHSWNYRGAQQYVHVY